MLPTGRARWRASRRAIAVPGAACCQARWPVAASKPTALFYDIVYQPRSTVLLNLARAYGRTVMNGLAMNQGQAVIAFCKTIFPGPDAARVEQIMSAVP